MTLIEFKLSITGLDEGTVPVEVKRLKPLNPVGVVGASPRKNISDTDIKQLMPLNPGEDNSGLQIRVCSSKLVFFFLN